MKPKVLFIYIDISAKLGIIPYLSSIFSSWLEFESVLADKLNPDTLERYQLILFSSALCRQQTEKALEGCQVPTYQCVRDLNYTHVHKILEIPAHSKVCIVSDREKNCEAVLTSLTRLGFTQYIYTIYYPGCKLPDPSFQHAITPGEARFVPSTIRNVVDIGNRCVDMATLCYIIKRFQLPESILNHVSNSYTEYLSNFMRHINFRSEDSMRFIMIRDKLLDAMGLGVCVVDSEGRIQMANRSFCRALEKSRSLVKNSLLTGLLEELGIGVTLDGLLAGETVRLKISEAEGARLFYAGSFEASTRDLQFLFLLEGRLPAPDGFKPPAGTGLQPKRDTGLPGKDSNLYRLVSGKRRMEYILHTALSYAESEFPVLLLGEPGLGQLLLARLIHKNSHRAGGPFFFMDAGHPFSGQDADGELRTVKGPEELQRLMAGEEPLTLFIDHLERASGELQSLLCAVLGRLEGRRKLSPDSCHQGPRLICSFDGDIRELAASGAFLTELFFQLSTLTLRLPPIRELKEYIPELYDYAFGELFLCSQLRAETMFTGQLLEFLKNYEYPGNYKELENLCRYFYYIYNGKRLTLAQLPSYINCWPGQKEPLSLLEREVLDIIWRYPHSGRNKILVLLSAKGTELTSHQIRTLLTELSDKSYIRVLKTKQGCEITELGEYMLQCSEI